MTKREAAKTYLKNQLESMTPVERMLIVYDVAIKACETQDAPKLQSALHLLKHTLNAKPAPQLALDLDAIYSRCLENVQHQPQWQQIADALVQLRESWTASIASHN